MTSTLQEDWIYQIISIAPNGTDPYIEKHRDGEYSVWEKYEKQKEFDERSVMPNELILDYDCDTTEEAKDQNKLIVQFLEEKDIPFYITDTGGTGWHIHIFFNIKGISLKEYQPARKALYELMKDDLKEYGVDVENLDDGMAHFDHVNSKGHLVRAIGGEKLDTNRLKTYVDNVEKNDVYEKEHVDYPSSINVFNISKEGYVDTYYKFDQVVSKAEEIHQATHEERQRKKNQTYNADDSGLDAVRNIPASKVLNAIGYTDKTISTDQMISCTGHNDSTPSMYITEEDLAICWGKCGETGKAEFKNAIDLVMEATDKEFKETVQWLCEEFDLENPLKDAVEKNYEEGRIEISTKNFDIFIGDIVDIKGELKAEISGSFKKNSNDVYYEKSKLSKRSVGRFAKTLCKVNSLNPDKYRDEIETTVLRLKNTVKEFREELNKKRKQEKAEKQGIPETAKALMKKLFREGGSESISSLERFLPNARDLALTYTDYMLVNGEDVILTEEGEEQAKEYLGLDELDVDVKEKADEVLGENPLEYFLDSINRLHKGDYRLKLWELISALSAFLSDLQIHSWAVGASVTGETPVFVKKDEGWEVQSIRKLFKEYEGQDWKTVGLNTQTLESKETDIKDIIEHKNKRKLVTIKTQSGREITGTLDHSFLKKDGEKLSEVSGEDLKVGDKIPILYRHKFGSDSNINNAYLHGFCFAKGCQYYRENIHKIHKWPTKDKISFLKGYIEHGKSEDTEYFIEKESVCYELTQIASEAGLFLEYRPCDKDGYLKIYRIYCKDYVATNNVVWDKITNIEVEEEHKNHRVYDIVAGENARHFLLGNGAIVHNSGNGKSFLKRNISKYLPEEHYVEIGSISPKVLMYLTEVEPEGSAFLKNKLLFIDEADDIDDEDTIPLLRKLTDNDRPILRHNTVEDQNAKSLVLEKPITVWFTSVESINDEQLKNRFVLTNPDTSEELDDIVNNHQQKRLHSGDTLNYTPKEAPVVQEMIRMLEEEAGDYNVLIPYFTQWKQKFNRRLYPIFANLLKIITRIYHRNREIVNGDTIIATAGDFKLASELWGNLIETTIAQEDEDSIELVKSLPETKSESVTTSELAQQLEGFSTEKVRRKVKSLRDTEELALVNTWKDKNKWRVWAGKDREMFTSPFPELVIGEDIVSKFLEDNGIAFDYDLYEYIQNGKTPVYEELTEGKFIDISKELENDDFTPERFQPELDENPREEDTHETVERLDKQIENFLKQPDVKSANFVEIQQELNGYTEHEIEKVITRMLDEGELMEVNPGQYRMM